MIEPKDDFRLSKIAKRSSNLNLSSIKILAPFKNNINNIECQNLNSNEKLSPKIGNMNNYFSNPFLIYDDINENIRNTLKKEIANNSNLNHDFSLSLEKAYLPSEIEKIHGNYDEKFDSLGYMEEDSDDNKENIDDTFFNSDNTNKEKILPDDIENINQNEFNTRQLSSNNKFSINSNRNKVIPQTEVLEKSTIKDRDELDNIFRGVNKFNVNYLSLFQKIIIKNENLEDKTMIILKPDQMFIILRYMYEILHPFFIDLSDQLLIERIKYFEKDIDTYISIINQYVSIKDKTFNYILEDLMKKLKISDEIIDSSFSYYINLADKNNQLIQEINIAYDDIIHADYK